jgi:hypothetical protein
MLRSTIRKNRRLAWRARAGPPFATRPFFGPGLRACLRATGTLLTQVRMRHCPLDPHATIEAQAILRVCPNVYSGFRAELSVHLEHVQMLNKSCTRAEETNRSMHVHATKLVLVKGKTHARCQEGEVRTRLAVQLQYNYVSSSPFDYILPLTAIRIVP